MAGHAIRPKSEDVLGGEGCVDLQVTVGAGALVERSGVIFDVAIFANEDGAIYFCLMRL